MWQVYPSKKNGVVIAGKVEGGDRMNIKDIIRWVEEREIIPQYENDKEHVGYVAGQNHILSELRKLNDREIDLVKIIEKAGVIEIDGKYTYYFTPKILAEAIESALIGVK